MAIKSIMVLYPTESPPLCVTVCVSCDVTPGVCDRVYRMTMFPALIMHCHALFHCLLLVSGAQHADMFNLRIVLTVPIRKH